MRKAPTEGFLGADGGVWNIQCPVTTAYKKGKKANVESYEAYWLVSVYLRGG